MKTKEEILKILKSKYKLFAILDDEIINSILEPIFNGGWVIYNNEEYTKISIEILIVLNPKSESSGRESTISGLAEALNSSNPTITKYLDKMVRVGIIGYTQKNPRVFYIL